MKLKKIAILILFIAISIFGIAQKHVTYNAFGPEFILSSSNFEKQGVESNSDVRFSGFFNWGNFTHINFSNHVGLITGFEFRNVGMINSFSATATEREYKLKQRVYTFGFPLALKFGNMNDLSFVYAGVNFDFAYQYKEKKFVDSEKQYTKTAWFSRKTNTFMPSVFVGIQFRKGNALTVRYYLNNMLNNNYVDGNNIKIYEGTRSQMINLSYSLLLYNIKNKDRRISKPDPNTQAKN